MVGTGTSAIRTETPSHRTSVLISPSAGKRIVLYLIRYKYCIDALALRKDCLAPFWIHPGKGLGVVNGSSSKPNRV